MINWSQLSHLGNVIVATEEWYMVLEKLSTGFQARKQAMIREWHARERDINYICKNMKDSMFKSKYCAINKGKNYKGKCKE